MNEAGDFLGIHEACYQQIGETAYDDLKKELTKPLEEIIIPPDYEYDPFAEASDPYGNGDYDPLFLEYEEPDPLIDTLPDSILSILMTESNIEP